MAPLRPRTARHTGEGNLAGLVAHVSDDVHLMESGFAGQTALCGAGSITRPLRVPFDPAMRSACVDCVRLAAAPETTRAELLL